MPAVNLDQDNNQKRSMLLLLVTVAAALVVNGSAWWAQKTPQEQLWIKLNGLGFLYRVSSRLAWREGHQGMGDELAGRDWQRYSVAYRLSQARDFLSRALEEMRP